MLASINCWSPRTCMTYHVTNVHSTLCCRVFLLIENSNQTPPGREYNSTDLELSTDEAVLEVGILSSFIPIMQQSSAEIYKVSWYIG